MSFRALSQGLDNLYTTTWENRKNRLSDQIFDAVPFFMYMRDTGKIDFEQGGRFITEPLRYAKMDNVAWIGKGGTVSLNDTEFLTEAHYDWRYQAVPIVRFGVDDQKNRGKSLVMRLMDSKMDNAKDTAIDSFETRLFAAAGSESTGIDGLQLLVADDPSTGTVGGVDRATYTWFQNQTQTLSSSSFATNGLGKMRTILNQCRNNLGSDAPDFIVSGQDPYEYYEDTVEDRHRIIGSQKMLDAGFENLAYKGIPMVWSPSCGDRMYFLNTRFLRLVIDPMMNFDMTDWKQIPEQPNDRAAQIVTAAQLTMSRARCQGVIHTIDTP